MSIHQNGFILVQAAEQKQREREEKDSIPAMPDRTFAVVESMPLC
jgi:hypothetical protein